MSQEFHLFSLRSFPHPWPPPVQQLILGANVHGEPLTLIAFPDGRLFLQLGSLSFVSQPVDIHSTRPEFAVIEITIENGQLELLLSGDQLLQDATGVARYTLKSIQGNVPDEVSINDPNASTACQVWIQNRKQKFAQPASPQIERRPKVTQAQADDLLNSAKSLQHLQQQVLSGKQYLLGHVATALRASVYWPRLKNNQGDILFTKSYNPLLLRMASLADLPLPVYYTPEVTPFPTISSLEIRYEPMFAPRLHRAFTTDQIRDIQESLVNTVLWLASNRTITVLEAIKELAHTMGGAHYDEDASTFLDVLKSIKTCAGDELTIFICQTAEVVASLSEWVLSELKTRNLIS